MALFPFSVDRTQPIMFSRVIEMRDEFVGLAGL
jgi:hypothetical protein